MAERAASYVLVVDGDRRDLLVGILTARDLVQVSLQSTPLDRLPIRAVMTHPVVTLPESAVADLGQVMMLFDERGIHHLPILSADNRLIGAIDRAILNAQLAQQALQLGCVASTVGIVPADPCPDNVARSPQSDNIQQSERQLQHLIEGTAATTGQDFFPALATWIAQELNVSYAVVLEKVDDKLQTLAFWAVDRLQPSISFSIAKTPCEQALQGGKFYCETSVQQQFPAAGNLAAMAAQSYLGVALHNSQGQAIGNLCILDRKPIDDPSKAESLLRVFAARAGAELERERATTALAQLNQHLEQRVVKRTAALQKSEYRYRALMEGATDAIFLSDDRGRFIEGNHRAATLLGYSLAELDSFDMSKIHPPEELATVHQHIASFARAWFWNDARNCGVAQKWHSDSCRNFP